MKQEILNKLNKKDKEEFLDKHKKIWGKNYYSLGLCYCGYIFYYLAFVLIATPLWYIAFEIRHPELLSAGNNLFFIAGKVLLLAIVFGFILDYFIICFKLIKSNKLKKEYFDIVPKRK